MAAVPASHPVLSTHGLTVRFGGHVAVNAVTADFHPGTLTAIVGPNGAGKTTLLRTVAGDLPPLDGSVAFGHQVQPGYLAQLRDAAIPGATVLDALMEAVPLTPGEARGYLAGTGRSCGQIFY